MHDPSCNKITHENDIDAYVATRAYPDTHEHYAEYTSPLSAFNLTKISNGESHESR